MKKMSFSPSLIAITKHAVFIFVFVINIPLFSQQISRPVKDKWVYSFKCESKDTTLTKTKEPLLKNVTFICSNQRDSIKIIQAESAANIKDTNIWRFKNGNISICDKFGVKKTSQFEVFEIMLDPEYFSKNNLAEKM